MTEFTSYVIKPNGMLHRYKIKHLIIGSGLEITDSKILLLSEQDIRNLYSDVPEDILVAKIIFFSNFPVEVGILKGENAIEIFHTLCGSNTIPSLCEPGSIRHTFGCKEPIIVAGIDYYLNVIHRPNKKELKENLKIIKSLLSR